MRKISKLGVGMALVAATGTLVFVAPASAGSKGEYAVLTVNKAVVGTPPPGAEFVIEVDCIELEREESGIQGLIEEPPFVTELTFGAAGGSEEVLIGEASECIITETENGGATSSSEAATVLVTEPIDYEVTFVNTFAEVSPTSQVVDTTTTAAAAPAAATPRFTG